MSFGKDIQKGANAIKKDTERTMRGAAISAFSGIIRGSPVLTGRFRGNWIASGTRLPDGELARTDKSGSSTTAEMKGYVSTAINWGYFSLTNNLPYAERIELYGHSQKAPAGVVRVNLKRVSDNLFRGQR